MLTFNLLNRDNLHFLVKNNLRKGLKYSYEKERVEDVGYRETSSVLRMSKTFK